MAVKKAARKSRSTRKTVAKTSLPLSSEESVESVSGNSLLKRPIPKKLLVGVLVLVALLVLAWQTIGGFFLPATVNGQPIFGWEYFGELHSRSGSQTLDSLITQKLLVQEAKKRGVNVSADEVQERISQLEKDLEASGGLDQALSFSGMTRVDLESQISLNLMVEKLVDGDIQVSDEDVAASYEESKEYFAGVSEEEARAQVRQQLRSDKIQEKITSLVADLRNNADIKNFLE